MITIKNKERLVGNGKTQLNQKARALALESLEFALNAVDPKKIMKSKLLLEDSTLKVNGYSFDLERFRNIYVLGGGKASGSMAEALEHILGKHVTSGLVNVPQGIEHKTKNISLNKASHPIPDKSGVDGTRRMLEVAEKAEENDLIICLISGGGSSLMPLPHEDVPLVDKREITDALLKCGATIREINTVRKHVSSFKGGWLAKKAYPATILNLILSDVVGDPLDSIASGPTVPDSTTFHDAIKVLKKHSIWNKAPTSIKEVLLKGEEGLILETPKADDPAFKKVNNVVVGNNRFASFAAREHLRSAGLNTLLLTASLEGEARHTAAFLTSMIRETLMSGNPVPKPAGIIAGGETTVTVTGKGLGGRNQEMALAAALELSSMNGVVVSSLSTDGIDGPTDAAGAIVDGKTLTRAEEMGLDFDRTLAENDSYNFFSELDDLIFTGPTGTNVNDVSIVVIL